MTGLVPLKITRTVSMNAASGQQTFAWPGLTLLGARYGFQGIVKGAHARITTGSGFQIATIKLHVIDAHDSYVDPSSLLSDFDNYPDEVVVFRSSSVAVVNPTGSATDADIHENFSENPVLFAHGLVCALEWTTSAGSGARNCVITLDLEVAAP